MPLFIDVHELTGATMEQIAEAHVRDAAIQGDYGVTYVKWWLNPAGGKVFCLCEAPNAQAAEDVHRAAHGLIPERIIEVDPDLAEGMLGGAVAATGAALLPGSAALDPALRTIIFTDIVGSTELTQRLGDRAALAIVELHDRVVRDALAHTFGREVKHLGDGMMGVFVTATDAVRCASAVHAALRAAGDEAAVETVRVRVGAATGEPLERNGDFFGSTVQMASRLCAMAEPGQTLVSSSVVEACEGHRFRDVGERTLKGFPQPIRAHAVVEVA